MAASEEAEQHPAERSPGTIKHLEFIQSVIGRLGNNGFLIKGWAITVAGLFFGFAIDSNDGRLGLASLIPILLFWGIDAYFLWAERRFRALYAFVADEDERVPPFYMAATGNYFKSLCKDGTSSYFKTLITRPALWVFYSALFVSAVAIMVLLGGTACADLSKPAGEDPNSRVDATPSRFDTASKISAPRMSS